MEQLVPKEENSWYGSSSRNLKLDDGFQAQTQVPYLPYNDNNLQTCQRIVFAKSGEFLSIKILNPPYQQLKGLDNIGFIEVKSRLVSFKSKRTNDIMKIDSKFFKVNLGNEFLLNQGDLNKMDENRLKDEDNGQIDLSHSSICKKIEFVQSRSALVLDKVLDDATYSRDLKDTLAATQEYDVDKDTKLMVIKHQDDVPKLITFRSTNSRRIMKIDSRKIQRCGVSADESEDKEPLGQFSKKRNRFYPIDSIFSDDGETFNGKHNQKNFFDITDTRIRYNRKFLLSFVEKFSFTGQKRKQIHSVEEEDMQPVMKRARTLAYCFNSTATYGEEFGFELKNMAFDPGDGNKLLDASSKKRNRSMFDLNSTVPKRRRQNYLVPKQMVRAADIKGNFNAHNSNSSISAFTLSNRAPWFVNENQSLELQAKVTPTEATSRENLVARQICQGNKRKFIEDTSSFESFTFQPPAKRLKVNKSAVAVTCLELQGKYAHISPMNTTTNIDTCFHYSCVPRFFNCCKDKILMVILLLSSFTTKDFLFRRCLIDILKNILCDIDQEKLEFLFCSRRNISYTIWLHYHINLVLYLQHNKFRTQVNFQHELIYVISFLWKIWVDRKDYSPMKDLFDASNAFSKHHKRIRTSRKAFMKSVIGRTPHCYGKVATFVHSGLATRVGCHSKLCFT